MNSAGNQLVGNFGSYADAQVTFAPTSSGTYYLSARSLDSGETGAYTLSAAEVGPNIPTVATIADHSLHANQWSTVASWISYSDADDDPATQYQFWDGGRLPTAATSGHPTTRTIRPTPRSRSRPPTSTMCGCAAARSAAPRPCGCAPSTAPTGAPGIRSRFTTLPNTPPVATINDHSLHTNEWRRCRTGCRYSDADGNAATQYQFWDGGTGANSGYFWTPGNAHHAGRHGHHGRGRRPRQRVGARRPGRRLRDHVGARLRRHRLERMGFVQLHDAAQHRRRSPPSTTTACTPTVVAGRKLDLLLGRRRQCGDAVPVLGRRHGANSGYFWTPDNAHQPADTAITVAASDLDNVWVRGGRPAAPRRCGCAPSTAPTGAHGIRSTSRRSPTPRRSRPSATTGCEPTSGRRSRAGSPTPTPTATRRPSTSSGTAERRQQRLLLDARQRPPRGRHGHRRGGRRPRQCVGAWRQAAGTETMWVRAFDGTELERLGFVHAA